MSVELLRVQTADGVRLDGALSEAAGGAASGGFDAVLMQHGVGGNFYNPSFFEPITKEFVSRGVTVLRANNRGHDLMYNSPAGRLGAAFETVDDCRHDWKAWLDLLEGRGHRGICVFGHSLGAVKAIHHAALEQDPRVVRVIAASPPRFNHANSHAMDTSGGFKATYERAQALVQAGNGDELITITVPTSAVMAAKTYVDKYGPTNRYDLLGNLPGVSVPTLVTIGGEEGKGPAFPDWYSFGGLATKVASLAEGQPNLTLRVIPGADHGYSGKSTELWAAVDGWVRST